jgi:hypothetical protein
VYRYAVAYTQMKLGLYILKLPITLVRFPSERVKWQKVRMKAEDIAWIEEASKALKQEPIKLEFLEEALVA